MPGVEEGRADPGLGPVRAVKRALIFIIGISVVAVGTAMLVLPGPAVVVIPAGLAILGTEFAWARRVLDRVKDTIRERTARARPERDPGSDVGPGPQ